MKDNPKSTVITVAVIFLVGVIGFSLMRAYNNPLKQEAKTQAEVPAAPSREKQYEDMLNGLLHEVDDSMKAYRSERKVLTEALNPVNLYEPAYVEENNALVQQLLPSLQQRMDDVMQKFSSAESRIQDILADEPEASRQTILSKWNEMRDTQVKNYSAYFLAEKDLLAAYQQLMLFYYAKRADFTVDMNTGSFMFKNPQDAAQEQQMRLRIEELQAQENALVNQ